MSDLKIGGLGGLSRYTPLGRPLETTATPDFKDTLKEALSGVNGAQLDASGLVNRIVAGEEVDLHEVMISAEEASVAFELLMEIRNKLLEGYQEIMRMQV
jgi:flagellar hook-basal body complex protein FliE